MFTLVLFAIFALHVSVFLLLTRARRGGLAALFVVCAAVAWMLAFTAVSTHLAWAAHVVWVVPAVWLVVAMRLTRRPNGPPSAAAELNR